jgi:hypothetical protein
MDGSPVRNGDTVYDVVYGAGQVVELLVDGRFVVALSGGARRITFTGLGFSKFSRARTLYWHNPVIITPSKDDSDWHRLRRIIGAMVSEMRRG